MPVDTLATEGTKASAGMVFTKKARIFLSSISRVKMECLLWLYSKLTNLRYNTI